MGKYQTYLDSDHWRSTRNFTMDRVRSHAKQPVYQCEKCKEFFRNDAIHVHHKHYRTVGRERQEDLLVLCKWCHAETHGKQTERGLAECLFSVGNKEFYLERLSADRKNMSDGENAYRKKTILRSLEIIERDERAESIRNIRKRRAKCRAIGRERKVSNGESDG